MTKELETLLKALDGLLGCHDRVMHPVIYRSMMPDKTIGPPRLDEGMHKCRRCLDRLFEVDQAYHAFKEVQDTQKVGEC